MKKSRLARRKHLGFHHPQYMAWIATLPCAACGRQLVEVAHVGAHGMAQKCSDRDTIPLCTAHHREGPFSLHRLGRPWWIHFGIDRDTLIADLQRRFDNESGRLIT